MYEELIPVLATATRIACTPLAGSPPATAGAQATSVADVEIFGLLAESVLDPGVAKVLRLGPHIVRDLALTAGPAADPIISNSCRRLTAHLRAADAEAAEDEMQRFLTCLHFMWRLALRAEHAGLTWPPRVSPHRRVSCRRGVSRTGSGIERSLWRSSKWWRPELDRAWPCTAGPVAAWRS